MLLLAFAFAAAVPPIRPPDPPLVVRPPNELRCVYERASKAVRDEVGRHLWAADDPQGRAVFGLLGASNDLCRIRHDWGIREVVLGTDYAVGASLLHYARARLARMGIDLARMAGLYRALPVEERTRPLSQTRNDRLRRELRDHPASYAADPAIEVHGALYLYALAEMERAERAWASLPPHR